MGDRANVVISSKPLPAGASLKQALDGNIVLYTHWKGYCLMQEVRNALVHAGNRIGLGDEAYSTRIIVSQIVGDQWNDETGFGLSVGSLCDNSYPIIVMDLVSKSVLVFDESSGKLLRESTIASVMKMSNQECDELHCG